MLVKGDIKCLHCGYISGEWVGVSGSPLTIDGMTTPNGAAKGEPGSAIHCTRCSGPVILEDANAVLSRQRIRRIQRLRAQIAAYDASAAGRAA